ncbi:MAG: undecaprenyl diphosphate synthase family protein [bacterium]
MKHLAFILKDTGKEYRSLGGLPVEKTLEKVAQLSQAAIQYGFDQVSFFFKESRETLPPNFLDTFPFKFRILEKGVIPHSSELPLVNLGFQFSEKEFLANLLKGNPDFQFSENDVQEYMSNLGWVEPDLIIFTGGSRRLSDSLTWSMAYSELFFSSLSWSEFSLDELERAIAEFFRRERRFGKINE